MIKARKVFHSETLKTLCHTFLYPYLSYCVEVWSNTYCSYLDLLAKLQNRDIKIDHRQWHKGPYVSAVKDLRWLSLSKIYLYNVLFLCWSTIMIYRLICFIHCTLSIGTSPDVIHTSLIYSTCPKMSPGYAVEQLYSAGYHFTIFPSTE